MAKPTPQQLLARDRFESLIGLAAPALDLLLAAGERLSRLVGPEDEYYPIRPPGEAFELEPTTGTLPPGEEADAARMDG